MGQWKRWEFKFQGAREVQRAFREGGPVLKSAGEVREERETGVWPVRTLLREMMLRFVRPFQGHDSPLRR